MKKLYPELSVIIPCKNEASYLIICLNALRKSISEWGGKAEIILVDNGSKDKSPEIARGFGCRVIESHEPTVGRLRNAGAKDAHGQMLAFLDADCQVDGQWVKSCLDAIRQYNIAVVGTPAIPELENGTWVEHAIFTLMSGAPRSDFPEWIGTSNMFVSMATFKEVGGFDECLETGEDVDFCYKIRKSYRIFLLKTLHTVHLKESKNLKELFLREFWRGRSSLRSFIKKNFPNSELFSVAGPGIIITSWTLIILMICIHPDFAIWFLIPSLTMPVLFIKRKRAHPKNVKEWFQCYTVAAIYIFARACSLGWEIRQILFDKFSMRKNTLNN